MLSLHGVVTTRFLQPIAPACIWFCSNWGCHSVLTVISVNEAKSPSLLAELAGLLLLTGRSSEIPDPWLPSFNSPRAGKRAGPSSLATLVNTSSNVAPFSPQSSTWRGSADHYPSIASFRIGNPEEAHKPTA